MVSENVNGRQLVFDDFFAVDNVKAFAGVGDADALKGVDDGLALFRNLR